MEYIIYFNICGLNMNNNQKNQEKNQIFLTG